VQRLVRHCGSWNRLQSKVVRPRRTWGQKAFIAFEPGALEFETDFHGMAASGDRSLQRSNDFLYQKLRTHGRSSSGQSSWLRI
jgi:hypothetical protein